MVLDASLFNTLHYKIKSKWSNPEKGLALSPTLRADNTHTHTHIHTHTHTYIYIYIYIILCYTTPSQPMVGKILFSDFLSTISMSFKIQKKTQCKIIMNQSTEQIIPYKRKRLKLLIFFVIISISADLIFFRNVRSASSHTHTHTHTFLYIYINVCVWVRVFVKMQI